MSRGQLVTLDGPGGAGKSTLLQLVTGRLEAAGVTVHATTEPSHGPAGQLARGSTAIFHGHALACLVAADRYYHVETEIEPALGAGKVVICDRYVPSSYALQVLDGVDQHFVAAINAHAPQPDLAVILTCDPVILQQRLATRGSHGRFEDNPDISYAESARFRVIAKMLPTEGIRTLVLDSTRHHADFLARQLTTVIQTLRSLPHQ
ncbi:dTMP kinase [Actinoallomurus bryophytorum]|uniref:Thymidylate kinase n=1 Tax=Actinoallomurus bryophytorum TaxID=1490222 RepID=A0A543CJP7_9ACTN|nr:dTMP kinase [Actinoallomurus bryophytorum]TQL97319.1 dTMP kinase [Actinoallomurus bryophytorum]